MDIELSEHAFERMKERLKLNKKSAARLAEKAYNLGISHGDTSGRLFKFISSQCLTHKKKGTCIKVYGEMVYIFLNQDDKIILITVYQIPNNLKNQALGLQKK